MRKGDPNAKVNGPNGLRMLFDAKDYLNDDGSVNTTEVNEAKERHAEQYLTMVERQIDNALEDGVITEAQATELKQAFGI